MVQFVKQLLLLERMQFQLEGHSLAHVTHRLHVFLQRSFPNVYQEDAGDPIEAFPQEFHALRRVDLSGRTFGYQSIHFLQRAWPGRGAG